MAARKVSKRDKRFDVVEIRLEFAEVSRQIATKSHPTVTLMDSVLRRASTPGTRMFDDDYTGRTQKKERRVEHVGAGIAVSSMLSSYTSSQITPSLFPWSPGSLHAAI